MSASLVGEQLVKPGDTRQVEVSIATTGRSGPVEKAALVQTDHPDNAQVSLKIKANVVVDLDFATSHVMFTDVKVGDVKKQKIELVAADPAAVKFGEVKAAGEGIQAKVVKTGTGPSTAWALEVVFSPKTPGPASGTIQVALVAPEEKSLQIFYSGQVKGDISIEPLQVVIRKTKTGEAEGAMVQLTCEKSFTIKSAADAEGLIDVKVETVTPGKHYTIVLGLAQKAAGQDRFGVSVQVKTSLASQPQIDIPVYVMTTP